MLKYLHRLRDPLKSAGKIQNVVRFHTSVVQLHVGAGSTSNISLDPDSKVTPRLDVTFTKKLAAPGSQSLPLLSREASQSDISTPRRVNQVRNESSLSKSNLSSAISNSGVQKSATVLKTHTKAIPNVHGHSHSHSHTHSHEHNVLLVLSVDQFKNNPCVRITWFGLATNVVIAVGKFAGGIAFHSQALLADAVHALCDLVSDFLTLFSVGLASAKAGNEYPYGNGKIETVGSLAVSGILLMAGLSIGWTSLCTIVGPLVPTVFTELATSLTGNALADHHSHTHGSIEGVTDINAAWIAAASIGIKEWIFRATKKVAIESNSNVLMANAWHHRVDSLTSLVALVTISSAYFFNLQSLDAIGGLIVSGLIIKAGAESMLDSAKELVDQSIPKEDERFKDVNDVLHKALTDFYTTGIKSPIKIEDLLVLATGPNLVARATLAISHGGTGNSMNIKEMELVTNQLRHKVSGKIPNLLKLDVNFVKRPN